VSSELLLLDNSAWARISNPRLSQQRADEIASWMCKHRLVTCLPFLLEAGYSARSARDHDKLFEVLLGLPRLRIDDRVERRAISAQRQLARAGHHRLPPADLMLAATADVHGVGVLHYDEGFDVLREKTDLRFESVWLAARGTL
jgi:predicted nucleic acid-binding protein